MELPAYYADVLPFFINNFTVIEKQHVVYPEIKEVSCIDDFINEIYAQVDFNTQKVLIVFDINDTILTSDNANKDDNIYWDLIMGWHRVPDKEIADINDIANYADVICLTARFSFLFVDLTKYGINLLTEQNKINLNAKQMKLLADNGYSYFDNIIYSNYREKGTALKIFYGCSGSNYDKVFFIDNNNTNCKCVNVLLTDNNIPVQTYKKIKCSSSNYNSNITENTDATQEQAIGKNIPYFHSNNEQAY